jgi:hypothetical protein
MDLFVADDIPGLPVKRRRIGAVFPSSARPWASANTIMPGEPDDVLPPPPQAANTAVRPSTHQTVINRRTSSPLFVLSFHAGSARPNRHIRPRRPPAGMSGSADHHLVEELVDGDPWLRFDLPGFVQEVEGALQQGPVVACSHLAGQHL